VPALHYISEVALARAETLKCSGAPGFSDLQPCRTYCGDFYDLTAQADHPLRSVDIIFCYSTAMAPGQPFLPRLSAGLAQALSSGARVVTTDKQLITEPQDGWRFELLATKDGPNPECGGSTGYVYQLVKW